MPRAVGQAREGRGESRWGVGSGGWRGGGEGWGKRKGKKGVVVPALPNFSPAKQDK